MEERALAIALAMARTPEEQATVEHLADLRDALMKHRQAHAKEATANNALALSREEMDSKVKSLYMEQGTCEDVLRAHARTYFASVLVPDGIANSAREMQVREESFARAWIAAIGDPGFLDEMAATSAAAASFSPSPLQRGDRNQ